MLTSAAVQSFSQDLNGTPSTEPHVYAHLASYGTLRFKNIT
jgi:hypothetical protein